jgi:eukaryotic-like serine/threonine-protein kinase
MDPTAADRVGIEHEVSGSSPGMIARETPWTLRGDAADVRKITPDGRCPLTPPGVTVGRFTHDQGIVHRDLKSANVIVSPGGRVKVTDFGLAWTRATGTTGSGALVGTVDYMSPERLMGEEATEACDIYAIGVVLYELVTGRRPFDAELVSAVALKQIHESPVPPRSLNGAISPRLNAIVMRALEKAPMDRFPNAGAFIDALDREVVLAADTSPLAAAA